MNHHYRDIRDKIAEAPRWFDEAAVPRYCAFTPKETANIYANQAALVEIACQNCGERFLVAFSWSSMDRINRVPTLIQQVRDGSLHYGDPPNTGCCAAGPTMNCDDIRVVEFWAQGGLDPDQYTGPSDRGPYTVIKDSRYFDWTRIPELEIALADGRTETTGLPHGSEE